VTADDDRIRAFRPELPSPARIYNYLLGGKDHYPADRLAAEELLSVAPDIRQAAMANRAFLRRAVRFLVMEAGIRQFIEIGAGLPATENVHDMAQRSAPDARVAYVDTDPVVIVHARNMVRGVPGTAVVEHDLREPEAILRDPGLVRLVDVAVPTAVLMANVLAHVADEEGPAALIRALLAPFPAGSFLALAHVSLDGAPDSAKGAIKVLDRAGIIAHPRTRDQVRALLAGLEPVEPGLVWAPQWRPDPDTSLTDYPGRSHVYVAVARKAAGTGPATIRAGDLRRPEQGCA
jgi:S-adenosyl methyltransferase